MSDAMRAARILRATTEEMAHQCSVDMELWRRHSLAALEAADTLEALQRRVEIAEHELREARAGR